MKIIHPPIRGTIQVVAEAGQMAAGDPLGQKGYITPQFPGGISVTELSRSVGDVQRETIRFWFFKNFRAFTNYYGVEDPSDITPGRAPIGADVASDVLKKEFIGSIPDSIVAEVGKLLDGTATNVPARRPSADIQYFWEIIPYLDGEPLQDSNGQIITDAKGEPLTSGVSLNDITSLIMARLLAAEATIRELSKQEVSQPDAVPGSPGIGHNKPPSEIFSGAERVTLSTSLSDIKALLQRPVIEPAEVAKAAEPIPSILSRVGDRFKEGGKAYFRGIMEAAGGLTVCGLYNHWYYLAGMLIRQLSDVAALIAALLSQFGLT